MDQFIETKENNKEIDYYFTYFFFPFKLVKGYFKKNMPLPKKISWNWEKVRYSLWSTVETDKEEWDKKSSYNQELLYFHKYLRDVVYNLSGKREEFLSYYILKNGDSEVKFGKNNKIKSNDQDKGFYLSDVTLFGFKFSNIGILSIGVKNEGCSLEDALEFNMNFRYLYITDNTQLDPEKGKWRIFEKVMIENTPLENIFTYENHFAIEKDHFTKEINSIIANLLPFKYREEYTSILDHRMVLHTLICLNKELNEEYKKCDWKKFKQVFSRILFVDPYNKKDEYEYYEPYITSLMEKNFYKARLQYGTLYGFSRYSDATTLFGRYDLVENNFKSVYNTMSILGLYYRSALIDFKDKSSEATKELIKRDNWKENIKVDELRRDFLKFSNVWYFKELTGLEQGIEMFDMHRRAFGIEELYNEVKEEIEKLDEYIREQTGKEAAAINRLNWLMLLLTGSAVILGILSLYIGFFGMGLKSGWFYKFLNADLAFFINSFIVMFLYFLFISCLLLFSALIIYMIYKIVCWIIKSLFR